MCCPQRYYRGAVGALLVYDISKRVTFENLERWLQDPSLWPSAAEATAEIRKARSEMRVVLSCAGDGDNTYVSLAMCQLKLLLSTLGKAFS